MKVLIACILVLLIGAITQAQENQPAPAPPGVTAERPLTRKLQMEACYVKEEVDRAWQFRIVGNFTNGPGIYVIVYNEAGEMVQRAALPRGTYTSDEPFVMTVPADGKAQQYVFKILGHQSNLNSLTLPLTDLPFEVYGGRWLSFGGDLNRQRRIIAFQSLADGRPVELSGYKGDYRVLDAAGEVIADSKDEVPLSPKGRDHEPDVRMSLTLPAGRTYWLEPYGVAYFNSFDERLYLTFDADRWFEPSLKWSLKDRPWWKGLERE